MGLIRRKKVVKRFRVNPAGDDEDEDFEDLLGSVASGKIPLPLIRYRTGGSVSDWSDPSTAKHPVAIPPMIQAGSVRWAGSAATTGQYTFDYPVSFAGAPLLLCSAFYTNPIYNPLMIQAVSDEATVVITWATNGVATIAAAWFHWIAIGPAKVI